MTGERMERELLELLALARTARVQLLWVYQRDTTKAMRALRLALTNAQGINQEEVDEDAHDSSRARVAV
jgi:hypothetical protein